MKFQTERRDSNLNQRPSEQTGRPRYILHQGAVGEKKHEDRGEIDMYCGHTFVVKTLGCVFQSIQNKIWNMILQLVYL